MCMWVKWSTISKQIVSNIYTIHCAHDNSLVNSHCSSMHVSCVQSVQYMFPVSGMNGNVIHLFIDNFFLSKNQFITLLVIMCS